jgi:16S rRNA (cytidine1402-2'-O)-methyltransferase
MEGRIFLIPVTLGSNDFRYVLPDQVITLTNRLRYFIVENTRSARRHLRMLDKNFPIDQSFFYELNEHTSETEVESFLEPIFGGHDIGLLSEAGLPCIADPGNILIAAAHRKNIRIVPLSGPSSIILALISSGMNGQNFTFNGYLPVKQNELIISLREIEKRSKKGETQIFMETPYRARKTLETILSVCNPDTRLCIASDLTLESESISAKKIVDWRKNIPEINDRLIVFVIQA